MATAPKGDSRASDTYRHLPLVIVGAGGQAISVANVAVSAGYDIHRFVDRKKRGVKLLGVEIVGEVSEVGSLSRYSIAIAIGDNAVRERICRGLVRGHANLHFPALVHSSAIISSFASIGEGTVIMPNAVIGPNTKVGRFCLINTLASLDHDCTMLDFSSLAPRAVTGGGVQIGLRSAICIGAVIKHGVTIGDDSVVGAASYLEDSLPAKQVAYGIPAKKIRARQIGEPYL